MDVDVVDVAVVRLERDELLVDVVLDHEGQGQPSRDEQCDDG
jgi:hypothetical protein